MSIQLHAKRISTSSSHGTSIGPRVVWRRIVALYSLQRQRRQLAELEPHLLEDIGIDRNDAQREASRPFWDAPAHWQDRAK